jgi:predicted esterase
MDRETTRVRSARAMGVVCAGVCAAVGLAAMAVAPLARSQTPGASPAAAAAPAPSAVASSVGEQTTTRAAGAPEVPAWIEAENATGKAFVYPPNPSRDPSRSAAEAARPVTVLLHGMCGHPQSACGPFVDVSTSRGWLVCPRGEDVCGAGTRWRLRGPDDAKLVEASVHAVASEHEGEVDLAAPRVLVGFSLGGIAAVQIAQASSGTYAGLVVIASQVHPDAAMLRKAGVKRVVLAAGDLDMTSAPLQQDARALAAQGMPTRFVSLGKFGHGYPADMQERMREPMTWVAGGS